MAYTEYYVDGERFFSLAEAKRKMKETGKPGTKYKVYSNGDFVNCGSIKIKGSNKCIVRGERNCNSY